MKTAVALILGLLPGLGQGGGGSGVSYYIASDGSDSNDGLSPLSPWQTLAKVNAETFPAGVRVRFKGGDTFTGQLVLREGQHYGTPGESIVYESFGTGVATIQTANNAHHGVDMLNPHDVTVRNLNVIGTGDTVNTARGVYCRNALVDASKLPNVAIVGLEVSEFGVDGIAFLGDSNNASAPLSGFDAPIIDSCVVHNCTANTTIGFGMGITIRGVWGMGLHAASVLDPIIRNCIVYNCSGKGGIGHHSGNGIFIGEGIDGGLVEDCLAYNNGTNGTGSVAIWMGDCTDTIIQRCVARDHRASAVNTDGGGFDIDGGCQNCFIQYCYAVNCDGPGYLLYQWPGGTSELLPLNNNTIRYCIGENNSALSPTTYGELMFGTDEARDCNNNRIYGNTFFNNRAGSCAIMVYAGTTSRFVSGGIFNNIFVVPNGKLINSKGSVVPGSGFAIQGNLYWTDTGPVSIKWGATTYTSIAAWRAASSKETDTGVDTSIEDDPLLGVLPIGGVDSVGAAALAAYMTSLGSLARGTGRDLTALYGITPPQDFFGNSVPQNGYDRGCFESNTATMILLGTPVTAAVVDEAYTGFTITAFYGVEPYTYSVASGSLPSGITLNSSTGEVSGTPTIEGVSSDIVLQATDANVNVAQLAPFTLTVTADNPNLMDGFSWVQYQCDIAFQGNDVRFIKNSTPSPRGAKHVTGLTVGATYRCIGNVRRGTIPDGNGIWFRVTEDQPMTAVKLLELTVTSGNIAVNHTFVATQTSVYVGPVGLSSVNGQYVIIDNDFVVQYESGP